MKHHIPNTKIAERMLTRPEGATMREIRERTGSDQYAVLASLEARHYAIRRLKQGRETRYFAEPPSAPTVEVTVTSKGQVTIPVALRERLGVRAGGKLCLTLEANDRVTMSPSDLSISRLRGILGKPKRSLTVAEMDEVIRRSVVDKQGRRGR